jgi:hypothetical protein
MRVACLLLLVGCAHQPAGAPLGQASRPYTTLPSYLRTPIGEHDLTPAEKGEQVAVLLREIDSGAAELEVDPGKQQAQLADAVDKLEDVVPPRPDLLVPVQRMKQIVDEIPKREPEVTRRRLQAMTDLIRLRAHF